MPELLYIEYRYIVDISVQGQVLFLASLPKPRYKSHEKTDYRFKSILIKTNKEVHTLV